ncbi:MAG TPA: branched-chain amino acid ABC transporter permease [Candidatus Dormibacteraeota bacterium]|nr:branched-chain amino acid ABC transporter permease [Candidatus Dormibacteraeota bacterium]
MHLLIEAIGFGVASGAVLALGAVGFTLQFGISNVLNITYGSLMTLAAFLGVFLLGLGLNVWLVMALGGLLIGLASVALNRGLLAPLMRRGLQPFGLIIVTVSAGIVIQYVIVAVAGPSTLSYGNLSGATLHFLGWTLTTAQVVILVVALVLMAGLHVLLTRTQLGRAMRATSSNRTLARSCGIATGRIGDIAWFLSGTFCGMAGIALAITIESFDFTLGSIFLIPIIAAAVLGGVGQPYGAMVGGLVVGIVSQVSAAYWSPSYENVVALAMLIVMLLVRPRGLFGANSSSRKLLA